MIPRVLIACEYSGVVRDAFAKEGFNAWSCDILACERGGKHLKTDVRNVLGGSWDLIIAFPPCTYLCQTAYTRMVRKTKVTGFEWDKRKRKYINRDREVKMAKAAELFRDILNANCPRIAVENPKPQAMSIFLIGERPKQAIQPWQFGDSYTKATYLWLRGLPPLVPNVVNKPPGTDSRRIMSVKNNLRRSIERSRTPEGLARAMAHQWGKLLRQS